MEEFPPKFSKILVTPDPQYIPGYAGYCPQLKYNLGKTYGQLTAELLTSPDVARSGRLVLHSGRFPSTDTDTDTGPRDEIWRTYNGERRRLEKMIPGYTGFVPKSQNYFSRTYAETCREALTAFDRDQHRRANLQSVKPLLLNKTCTSGYKTLETPLTAISKEPVPYRAVACWTPQGSPYLMDDSSPHKYFISGFTGYVPKSRFLIGSGYPITTNKALIQFGKEMKSNVTSGGLREREGEKLPSLPTVYSSKHGLMPSYTGHVPGYQFTYGQTFGQLTHNALGIRSS